MSNPPSEIVRARILVSGKVQGVGYRYSTARQADRLGIKGWVKNLPDGKVEAVLEGSQTAVDAMLAWCRQGSPSAVVKEVAVEYETPQGLQGFDIAR